MDSSGSGEVGLDPKARTRGLTGEPHSCAASNLLYSSLAGEALSVHDSSPMWKELVS